VPCRPLGQFAKEPIAGITPFDEMLEAATLPTPRRRRSRGLTTPITQEGCAPRCRRRRVGEAVRQPQRVQIFGDAGVSSGIATLLRPIATPITSAALDRASSIRWLGVPRPRVPAGDGRRIDEACRAAGRLGLGLAAAAPPG
jgi:hypothetical protein